MFATYIRNLISLGIVKKETPYGESSGRKTIYSIEDNMFRFWYRFAGRKHFGYFEEVRTSLLIRE